jgi:enoyl-CoA hydratase
MTDEPTVLIEQSAPVAVVRLNRPEVHNALNAQVLAELDSAVSELASTPTVRAIVLTGAGEKAFSAGADLGELAGLNAETAHDRLVTRQHVIRRVDECPTPIIAAVNGLALGGGLELLLACTFPVLAAHASLGLPEAGLGLTPGYGGTQRLARQVGAATAAYVTITGARLSADRAYQLGMTPVEPVTVDRVVPTACELAERIASSGPRAVRAILTALGRGADAALESGLALESALAGIATGSREAATGIAAFQAKRQAVFDDLGVEH